MTLSNSVQVSIPGYVALFSLVLLAAQRVSEPYRKRRFPVTADSEEAAGNDNVLEIEANLPNYKTRKAYQILRFIGCAVLLVFSSITIFGLRSSAECGSRQEESEDLVGNAFLLFSHIYTTALALSAIFTRSRWSSVLARHINIVLLATLIIYGIRDLLPLAKFHATPADVCEGRILWVKIVILALTLGVIPLAIPREYVPVDPKNPMSKANPEQIAPLFSLINFFFLDPVVFEAYRVPHLPYERLPPLADDDASKHLKEKHFKHLDPYSGAKKRNFFINLVKAFAFDAFILVSLANISSFFMLFEPIAINKLLLYLEKGEEGTSVRPWLWVLLFFIIPILDSSIVEWYLRVNYRTIVRIEALLTQLVFEHALRIRLKAEVSDSDSAPESEAKSTEAKAKKDDNMVGKINNLVTTDLANLTDARNCLALISEIPLLLVLYTVFLYTILGWSAFVGIGLMVLLAPVPTRIAEVVRRFQAERMKKTDKRVHVFTDVINVLRMVKLFGWEKRMLSKVYESREEELGLLKKRQYANLLGTVVNFSMPIVAMAGTYATYVSTTLVMKQALTASAVFSSLVVFENMQRYIGAIFMYISRALAAKVSLERITGFLNETELLDTHTNANVINNGTGSVQSAFTQSRSEIGFKNATFSWSNTNTVGTPGTSGTSTPIATSTTTPASSNRKRQFLLKIKTELVFKKGCLNLVTGPTGSGKTSLLLALLGEIHFIPSGESDGEQGEDADAWFSLPRDEGVAYAAQESWVLNETIKNNILFTTPYDEARYKAVVHACGLERDLSLFEAGDETEVGEKGLTLSGGQKGRLTLARAIYSKAKILLLDDILAALDVHTAKWIVEKCLVGDLVKDRTIILVTHNVPLVEPIASFVVSLKDGQIAERRSCTPVPLEKLHATLANGDNDKEDEADGDEDAQKKTESKLADGKLIVAEEIQEGRISGNSVKLYASAIGGQHPLFYFSVLFGLLFLTAIGGVFQTWFLGFWASKYDEPGKVNVVLYLCLYVGILLLVVGINASNHVMFIKGTVRGAKVIHQQLADAILGTTLRWLDKTPTSRILTRFTQDINAIDSPIPESLKMVLDQTMKLILKLAAIVLFTPIFLVPGVIALAAAFTCAQIYLKAQMAVKREMSVAKAPVLGHFGATITGLTSIRAYGAQRMVTEEMLTRIDRYSRSARVFYNLQRWMAQRMQIMSAVFVGTMSWYLVYVKHDSASDTGFSINMAVTFTQSIFGWIIVMNMLEGNSNSIERVDSYLQIEQEPRPTEQGKPPAYWPASGDLRVENLCARYSPDGPEVLHGLSFHIRAGERIGVVGRTGSGKSSLTLSLLRCIYTTGEVIYDGRPTSATNLDALRSRITIIPQVPELISGTLRQNLDPFEEVDDLTLNEASKSAGLSALQAEMKEEDRNGGQGEDEHGHTSEEHHNKITLDTPISGGGSNLSVGQRQIVALARAMVRRSKLLILDEATSAIDYKTDNIIQSSLRSELGGDVTLITIAHRLQTIMDADRIMVLDSGNIVEFGPPLELLAQKDGQLRALVDESNDKEALFALAEGKR